MSNRNILIYSFRGTQGLGLDMRQDPQDPIFGCSILTPGHFAYMWLNLNMSQTETCKKNDEIATNNIEKTSALSNWPQSWDKWEMFVCFGCFPIISGALSAHFVDRKFGPFMAWEKSILWENCCDICTYLYIYIQYQHIGLKVYVSSN
jgi:hypothetical protein